MSSGTGTSPARTSGRGLKRFGRWGDDRLRKIARSHERARIETAIRFMEVQLTKIARSHERARIETKSVRILAASCAIARSHERARIETEDYIGLFPQVDIARSHERARIETTVLCYMSEYSLSPARTSGRGLKRVLESKVDAELSSPARTSGRGLKRHRVASCFMGLMIARSHERARIETVVLGCSRQQVLIARSHERARIETACVMASVVLTIYRPLARAGAD